MNARGEVAGRLAIALLAGMCGKEVLHPTGNPPDWMLHFLVLGIFACGYMFAIAPKVSQWVEDIWGDKDEGHGQQKRHNRHGGDHRGDSQ